jgi:hypothetical protein
MEHNRNMDVRGAAAAAISPGSSPCGAARRGAGPYRREWLVGHLPASRGEILGSGPAGGSGSGLLAKIARALRQERRRAGGRGYDLQRHAVLSAAWKAEAGRARQRPV